MGDTPDLPARPKTVKPATPPPAEPVADARQIQEQADMLRQYEEQQAALNRSKAEEEQRRLQREAAERAEFEQKQQEQAERERLAQEQFASQQMQFNNQQAADLQRGFFELQSQYQRDQIMLEQYDRVSNLTVPFLGLPFYILHSVSKPSNPNLPWQAVIETPRSHLRTN